jgi:hypothetical protein
MRWRPLPDLQVGRRRFGVVARNGIGFRLIFASGDYGREVLGPRG